MNLIAAVSIDGAIGHDDNLLWHISDDLKRYKSKTVGNVIIMGLNTFLSLPKQALKNRTTIVLCGYHMDIDKIEGDDVIAVNFIPEALELANNYKDKEIYVAGGAMLYDSMIDMCDELEITWVNKKFPDANKRFPIEKIEKYFDKISDQNWILDEKEQLEYKFSYYTKK